jgi:hypothetical protein
MVQLLFRPPRLQVTFPRLAQWGILENKIVNQHEFTIEAQSFNEPL